MARGDSGAEAAIESIPLTTIDAQAVHFQAGRATIRQLRRRHHEQQRRPVEEARREHSIPFGVDQHQAGCARCLAFLQEQWIQPGGSLGGPTGLGPVLLNRQPKRPQATIGQY